jgi:hypothetical protein
MQLLYRVQPQSRKWRLEPGLVERNAIDRQRYGKHMSAATNKHVTLQEMLEVMFAMRFVPRLCSEDN